MKVNGGEYRNRTGVHGFAIRQENEENQRGYVSNCLKTDGEQSEKVSIACFQISRPLKSKGLAAAATANKAQIKEADQLPADYTMARCLIAITGGANV